MTEEERFQIVSEDYADFIIDYRYTPQFLEKYADETIHIINEFYAIVYIPVSRVRGEILKEFNYSMIPLPLGLTSDVSVEASGVLRTRNLPGLNLTGEGVLIGIVDTGIDYQNPVFKKEDGKTKIAAIWDQTIETEAGYPFQTFFGTEFEAAQIDEALNSERPLDIVPSTDEIGHGTMMAGIAVGTRNEKEAFQGVAPAAELLVVKLKQAKNYLREIFLIPNNAVCYAENLVMWGVLYCVQKARQLKRPLAICLGVGTSFSAHSGVANISNFLNIVGDYVNVGIVTSVGNEGNLGRHFLGTISPGVTYVPVELNVGEKENDFMMVMWGDFKSLYSVDVTSPGGELIPRIGGGLRGERRLSFIFENTVLTINYQLVETVTGFQLIVFRFQNVSSGIWKINVYSQSDLPAEFDLWLPMGDFISKNTYFVIPNIYTTVLTPGSAMVPITVTAYNPQNNALYPGASRGYTNDTSIKPELAAPGVNYKAPALGGGFTTYTGTGVAASHTAGIVALFLEWAVVRQRDVGVDTTSIKNYLIRGAIREETITYPNRDWGFGILNIYNVFDILRTL